MDLSADALNSSEAQPESASSEDAALAATAMPLCDLAFRPWCGGSSALWFVSLMEALLAAVPFRPTKKCSRSRFLLISRTSRSSREAQEDVEEVEEAVEVQAFSALFGDPTALRIESAPLPLLVALPWCTMVETRPVLTL